MARTEGHWLERGTYLEPDDPLGYDILIKGLNKYLNFNYYGGVSGYGFRDNNGVIEFKDDGGSWKSITGAYGLNLQQVTDNGATTTNTITVPSVQFNTTAGVSVGEGQLAWNATDETLDLGMPDGITLQIGQEQQIKVRNNTGSTILNGKPVYETGMLGNRPTVAYAQGDTHAKGQVLGILTQDISNNADGKVTTSGYVRNINTTGTPYSETWNDGDALWLSKTVAGGLTNTEPSAPHHCPIIGRVVNAHATQGSILVNIKQHLELESLTDVDGSAPNATGDLLSWNNTGGTWERNAYNITDYVPYTGATENLILGSTISPQSWATITNPTVTTTAIEDPSAYYNSASVYYYFYSYKIVDGNRYYSEPTLYIYAEDYSGNNFKVNLSWTANPDYDGYLLVNTYFYPSMWKDVGNVSSYDDDGTGWESGFPTFNYFAPYPVANTLTDKLQVNESIYSEIISGKTLNVGVYNYSDYEPPTVTATINYGSGGYSNNGYTHIWRVYGYKTINGVRRYTNTFNSFEITDNGLSGDTYTIDWTVTDTSGQLEGYIAIISSTFIGLYFDGYYDNLSFGVTNDSNNLTVTYFDGMLPPVTTTLSSERASNHYIYGNLNGLNKINNLKELDFSDNVTITGNGTTISLSPTQLLLDVYIKATNTVTSIGYQSGTGTNSVFIGTQAGKNVTADSAMYIGYRAGINCTGGGNSLIGYLAGVNLTTGARNTIIGTPGGSLTTGNSNTVIGNNVSVNTTNGDYNTAIGTGIPLPGTGSTQLGAINFNAGGSGNTGNYNTVIGYNCVNQSGAGDGVLNIGCVLFGSGLYQGLNRSNAPTVGGKVGVRVAVPNSTLQVGGSMALPYIGKTANYTLTETDYTVNCTANSFTITLPTAVGVTGRIYQINNSGNGVITIATTSSQTISGLASGAIKLSQNDQITVQSTGTNWILIH